MLRIENRTSQTIIVTKTFSRVVILMAKKIMIKKNRSDQEMFAGFEEQLESGNEKAGQEKGIREASAFASFFTPELQEQVGRELLNLKIKLYNEGIVDFDLKVKTIDNEIILTPKPKKNKVKRV